MQVTGLPTSISAGATVCITIQGATGTPQAVGSGSVKLLSLTQSTSEPATWIACIRVGAGAGALLLEDSKTTKSVVVAGK